MSTPLADDDTPRGLTPAQASTPRYLIPRRVEDPLFSSSTLSIVQQSGVFAMVPFLHPALFGALFVYPMLIPVGLAPPFSVIAATVMLRQRSRRVRAEAVAFADWAARHLDEGDPLTKEADVLLMRTESVAFRFFGKGLVGVEAALTYLEERAYRK